VYERPRDFDETVLISVVEREYGLSVAAIEYLPVGYGAYHWKVDTADGARYFLTVDDLRTKSWFGPSVEATFIGLSDAYSAAHTLAASGLTFVVAAEATSAGDVVCRLDELRALSLTRFMDGTTAGFGANVSAEQSAQLQLVLAQLHASVAPRGIRIERPSDVVTEVRDGLRVSDWESSGPYTARVKRWLTDKGRELQRAVTGLEALGATSPPTELVVTHGEPHWGNVMMTSDGLLLVDWDTVALARSERDLWHISRDPGELSAYEQFAAPVQRDALEFYAMAWTLRDVVAYVRHLAAAEDTDDESATAWDNLMNLSFT
jgi:spectinomycin phosphotransferase